MYVLGAVPHDRRHHSSIRVRGSLRSCTVVAGLKSTEAQSFGLLRTPCAVRLLREESILGFGYSFLFVTVKAATMAANNFKMKPKVNNESSGAAVMCERQRLTAVSWLATVGATAVRASCCYALAITSCVLS